MRFPEDALRRQLDRRGMTQRDFAKIANVSENTVVKACKGLEIAKKPYGKILAALSVVPPISVPEGLEVAL